MGLLQKLRDFGSKIIHKLTPHKGGEFGKKMKSLIVSGKGIRVGGEGSYPKIAPKTKTEFEGEKNKFLKVPSLSNGK